MQRLPRRMRAAQPLRHLLFAFLSATLASYASAARTGLEDCTLTGTQGLAHQEARCGWLERPENPMDPESKKLRLRVAVIPALSRNPRPDAFTVINGGPGASSLELYADSAALFAAIRRERDIVVMDQRGTGDSNPLDCPQLESLTFDNTVAAIRASTSECLATLPGDPRYYTTSIAVRDLEALRQTLGYTQLDVYGISYGTRVAQHYARRYPDAVRTLIIDGVVPPDEPLGPNAALNAQRVLDRLLARCVADPGCGSSFPRLEQQLAALQSRLAQAPVSLSLPDPVTGTSETVEITENHLIMTVRMLSYAPETASLLPLIIAEAEGRANLRPLAANAMRIEKELIGAIRFGMHNAVVCAEDIPFLGPVDIEALQATYMGPEQVESLQTICKIWPTGEMDADLRALLHVPTPTLILSGSEDPITPPAYGARVHDALPNSVHLIGEGQGHGMLSRGCVPDLIAKFVESGDLESLDTSCVARLQAQPFFLDLLGPAP